MSALRAALILILAGGATTAFADQVTCESVHDRNQTCPTGGGDVTLAQQISDSPCVEGSTWGTNGDSIWVSGGCRAVFDVQHRDYSYNDRATYGDRDSYDNGYREDRHYASADRLRNVARRACIDRAAAGQSFDSDDVTTNDERWLGNGMFAVDLDTPAGRVECTVDRDGNVQSIDER